MGGIEMEIEEIEEIKELVENKKFNKLKQKYLLNKKYSSVLYENI